MGLPVQEFTRNEVVTALEEGALERLGVPAVAMLGQYFSGQLENPGAVGDLLAMALLLRDDDELIVAARRASPAPTR